MSNLNATVITVSDTCSKGGNIDTSGPYLVDAVKKTFPEIQVNHLVIPDDIDLIQNTLLRFSIPGGDAINSDLIITTGGTGFTKRDVTPEATLRVIQKQAPGITNAMCMRSLQITDMAMLSRSVCGINNNSLIINLPGSLKAVKECYQIIEKVLPHAINQIRGETCQVKATHNQLKVSNNQQQQPKKAHQCCSHKNSDQDRVAYRQRESIYPMMNVDNAIEMIVQCLKNSIEIKSIPVSVGQICMEDITAPEPYPPFRASIKDGYACISTDGKGVREVRDGVTAGEYNDVPLMAGECIRISTGAPVPSGADCVVQVEDTKLLKFSADGNIEHEIEIMKIPRPGQDIRQIGSDINKGETILHKNTYIGPAECGLLHSFGIRSIRGIRRIRLGVLSTGNEVRDANASNLVPGCIRDSNRPMLIGLLRDYADCVDLGVVSDDRDLLHKTLRTAFIDKQCDIIITSGGVSMGEKDLLKHVLTKELSLEILFGRVNMKPGKPTTFASGCINSVRKSIFGLPGNPVSAFVTCNLFVIPALKALMGMKQFHWPRINVELKEDVILDPRPEYARATFLLESNHMFPVATITGNQISSRLTSLVGAQILLELPSSSVKGPTLPNGSVVPALLINNI